MNQTIGDRVETATTIDASPPVAVAKSVVPRSTSVISAGAPATPLPATPTSTTATTACPAAFGAGCGRYIFCLPSTVTTPNAPVPPAAGGGGATLPEPPDELEQAGSAGAKANGSSRAHAGARRKEKRMARASEEGGARSHAVGGLDGRDRAADSPGRGGHFRTSGVTRAS